MSTTVNIPTVDVIGTNTNSNAAAGEIGEYISSTVAAGSAVPLTTATAANVTSIALSAGDWDISALCSFSAGVGTVTASATVGVNSTSATFVSLSAGTLNTARQEATLPASSAPLISLPAVRYSLASATTIYLVAQASFSVSTLGAYGTIAARRAR